MTPLNFETLKSQVPAIFTTSPSPKMSDKYTFVPTMDILENFEQEGWQVYSAKQTGRSQFATHEIRLRNGELPAVGDSLIEAVIRNSHNGLTTFSVSSGLHRLVCSNGLTVPTSLAEQFNIRHQNFDLGEVRRLTDSFASRLPIIQESLSKMENRELTMDEKVGFVKGAAAIRWKEGNMPSTMSIEEILNPLRDGDVGNSLWKVFNVVQEKMVRGGVGYRSGRGRLTSMRELKNISVVNNVNTKLWELAETYC
jgi:hypothetical protein